MLNLSDPLRTDADPAQGALAVLAFAMVSLVGTRTADTDKHILRLRHYVKVLIQRLAVHPQFAAALTPTCIAVLEQALVLHDVGTIGIPDRILLKPGPLTAAEFEIIKTHTSLTRDAIELAEKVLGYQSDLLQMVKELAYSHHEKWNGSGYPQGLAGEAIPLSARILAIADVYDALISDRVYRSGLSHDRAVAIIFEGRASHFDPDMVDAFIEIQDEFQAIALRFTDTESDMQKKMDYMVKAIAEEVEL